MEEDKRTSLERRISRTQIRLEENFIIRLWIHCQKSFFQLFLWQYMLKFIIFTNIFFIVLKKIIIINNYIFLLVVIIINNNNNYYYWILKPEKKYFSVIIQIKTF